MLVVLAHTVLAYGAPKYLAPLQFGGVGVDLFFVLSGWLLGNQLFKEAKSGRVDVVRFWVRRWMRTLPAYYAVLVATVMQRYLTKDNVVFPWEYFVFVQNYQYPLEFFSVSWSLCVEEQFYLFIAPFVAASVLIGRNKTTALLLVLLVLPSLFRELGWFVSLEETHVRYDGCLAGVFLAHLNRQYPQVWSRLSAVSLPLAVLGLFLFVYFVVGRYYPMVAIMHPDILVLALLFSSWVLLANSSDKWRAGLYFPGAYHIATRSYAIYLVHPEVLALLKRFSSDMNFVAFVGLSFLGSLLLAEILYRLVEEPFMKARERFSFSRGAAS